MTLSPRAGIVEFETLDHRIKGIKLRFFLSGIRENFVAYEFQFIASFDGIIAHSSIRHYKAITVKLFC